MIANSTAPVQSLFLKSTIRSGRLVDKGDKSFCISGRSPKGSTRPKLPLAHLANPSFERPIRSENCRTVN